MVYRVEIAGGIAVGKSMLCEELRQRGFTIITEKLDENPFLGREYKDKGSRGFDLGASFLMSKASGIETFKGDAQAAIVDYAMVAEYAYNDVHLKEADSEAHALVELAIDFRRKKIGDPDMLIHLHCPEEHQLANIKKRGRDFEQGHGAAYLKEINDRVALYIGGKIGPGCKILSINTQETDVTDPAFVQKMIAQIKTGIVAKRYRAAAAPETTADTPKHSGLPAVQHQPKPPQP